MPATDPDTIARVVHEAVRGYKAGLGEDALPGWDEAPDWQRESTRAAVQFRLAHPDPAPAAQHDQWMREKQAAGWRWGPDKDLDAKTHPLLVPYDRLPDTERRKDALIAAVVQALA